jgi:hypothetical protein
MSVAAKKQILSPTDFLLHCDQLCDGQFRASQPSAVPPSAVQKQ